MNAYKRQAVLRWVPAALTGLAAAALTAFPGNTALLLLQIIGDLPFVAGRS